MTGGSPLNAAPVDDCGVVGPGETEGVELVGVPV